MERAESREIIETDTYDLYHFTVFTSYGGNFHLHPRDPYVKLITILGAIDPDLTSTFMWSNRIDRVHVTFECPM